MTPRDFWTSQDGQVLAVGAKSDQTVELTLAFWPRNPAEFAFMQEMTAELKFTERSTLARIGIEMRTSGVPKVDGKRLVLQAEAFLYDSGFPHAAYWDKLFRLGTPIGRLFFAPAEAKLSTEEIWRAVQSNQLKLPDSISIDRHGQVFLTPHQVSYTLNPALTREDFERLVSGRAGRAYLDKVQRRHETKPLTISPRSGVLTSCSIYLKEHYVVLNQGEGNFGIHTSAVLLDPVKTFGTNIMLEIYNSGSQPVVNPLVSVEVFRAPVPNALALQARIQRREQLGQAAIDTFALLDQAPPLAGKTPKPRTHVSVRGQNSTMGNRTVVLHLGAGSNVRQKLTDLATVETHPTLIQALDEAPEDGDSLITDYFPNLLEQVEMMTRLNQLKLKRMIFRHPSRTHGFFLSTNSHSRLDDFDALGLEVYWYNPTLGDLYLHTYKRGRGFFIKEELVPRFQAATILAFYGSAVGLTDAQTEAISILIDGLTSFFGANVGVLTGGGGGVMRLATDKARDKGALTGACFLELEAQPPELGVDFFNTFQETARHNRQKWFEAADFCIFNVGGVGTLEEIGIELCNLKLGIRPRVPYVFFAHEFFDDLELQISTMIDSGRAPAWMRDYLIFTDDPKEVVAFYRKTLKVL